MAKRNKRANGGVTTVDYRHTTPKRTNIPPAKIEAEGTVPAVPKVRYAYSPHLDPSLRIDSTGSADRLPELIEQAGRRVLTALEQKTIADALRQQQPWLEWAGKREYQSRGFFDVDPVALHIHERVATQAMLRALAREDVQRDLFADPQQPYAQAIQFYQHSVDWANRLILGDSLQVMSSLAKREQLAGKVQMAYVDPPYGIEFKSNFQVQIGQKTGADSDNQLTREPETVKAFRDTWVLGIHSYLSFLSDRLYLVRELLADSGSIFVQINDANLAAVRQVLEEVFGRENFVVTLLVKKKGSQKGTLVDPVNDYVVWFAKDLEKARARFTKLHVEQDIDEDYVDTFRLVQLPTGEIVSVTDLGRRASPAVRYDQRPELIARDFPGARLFTSENATAGGVRANQSVLFSYQGRVFDPGLKKGNCWKHTAKQTTDALTGMDRMAVAERLYVGDRQVRFRRYASDFGAKTISNWWDALGGSPDQEYVVNTNPEIVRRCMLMTTRPGDLVLDPTCGGGTTALVAEHWGRRWITIDTSRIAIFLARHRVMTASFPMYRLNSEPEGPGGGFQYRKVAHIMSSTVANSAALDPIAEKHEPILASALEDLNAALKGVKPELRRRLETKLADKEKREGKRAVTEADLRRWKLPERQWQEWTVPFDTDPEWPERLTVALSAYRNAWREKMQEVDACIAANANVEELVDKPESVAGVVRVAGPFTVEGVSPEELSLGDDGVPDPAPDGSQPDTAADDQNVQSYFAKMIQHLRADGVTFLGNRRRSFAHLEPLFEDTSGSLIHAEGAWGDSDPGLNTVAVSFGPQYGPVTALQVEEAIRSAKRYDELVIAGFSFDAEAYASVEEQSHPKLRVHIAQIRPDVNSAMEGLLKDTPHSQLFTVFGQPDVEVEETKDGWVCTLAGVSIYDPLENVVRSTGAEKVTAWFLDSDFDGRCFCTTQAFFPDQDAWDKIAKALGTSANAEAFEKLKGTSSLPFPKGKFARIAVKVIDPRGNEVMAIRNLG